MTMLAFARGPALLFALVFFVGLTGWRLCGIALLRSSVDLSEPRSKAAWKGLRLIALRSWPRREFLRGSAFSEITGYTFHIGLLAVLFFYVPHTKSFAEALNGLTGANLRIGGGWPALPAGAATTLTVISLGALVIALAHRLSNPVKRLISNFDDYFSWFMTAAPLATGLVVHGYLGSPHAEAILAVHLLAVDALLIWFPCGKLMHAFMLFAARGTTGVLFERKGAAL